MKRFYKAVEAVETDLGWQVMLDGRPVKTQAGRPQLLPGEMLAQMLAEEWERQGEEIDPSAFAGRDMADYAIDVVAQDREPVTDRLLAYSETDTLCYRADPDEPLFRRQQEVWEPILSAFEAREGVTLHRVSGIMHRPQAKASVERLRAKLSSLGPFHLAPLESLTALTASLCAGMTALEPDADAEGLWEAAHLEENWQTELWGEDAEAAARQEKRRTDFLKAVEFARAVSA